MNTTYTGCGQSALKRVRQLLKKAGIPVGKVAGRYAPYGGGNTQHVIEGWNAHRIGCSDTIRLNYWHPDHKIPMAAVPMCDVLRLLREAGLPFDDRGWMETAGF